MRQPAQAMVEFALAMSIFMLLILGTFDLARGYLSYAVVTNAVREVSRYAAAHINDPGYQPALAQQAGLNLAVGLDGSRLTLTPPVLTTIDSLPYVTVTGSTYRFHSLTPLVAALVGDAS